ncbi:ABC transporter permease [Leifsonia sp. YAF41]|uniref:ABC transporter permease n=1 Tax=Leifsonia sp. YAF41 TaxID=3233086 RepID=UPI003F960DFE
MTGAASIIRLVAGRILGAAATMFATTIVVFSALYLVPGDPLSILLRGRKPTPELVEQMRLEYGLDLPFVERYWNWFTGLLQGDLGYSIQFQQNVADLIASRLPTTIWLVGYTAVLILIGGIALGVWSAIRGGRTDATVLAATSAMSALPAFVAALVLLFVFAGALGWFPTFGGGGPDVLSRIEHLTLPAVALAISYVGLMSRITRSAVRAELGSDHVESARLRGLGGAYLFRHHVARNATVPVLTYAGVLIAGLLVTSQLVESAFGLNGIGGLVVDSVKNLDLAVVQAVTLLVITAFVVTNLLVDLANPMIDVRLRRTGRAR